MRAPTIRSISSFELRTSRLVNGEGIFLGLEQTRNHRVREDMLVACRIFEGDEGIHPLRHGTVADPPPVGL
ncbi:hypothetical protein SGFS_051070 [Streptomyces graminofaciens]|uniref:Uncharacterized protein n=1 Tax=Streptomyces graminofaciens TaxID=68212 RepID=A0ABN5VL12_9ACTN|nr:hypothetical protein SGFS_051070 [Streptomyces graminofaciens]